MKINLHTILFAISTIAANTAANAQKLQFGIGYNII
jgi:hypothetical protein